MPAIRLLLALIVFSTSSKGAFTATGDPAFSLDYCAWGATHIVVVTEGEKIDGKVRVLESWKGDLKPGEEITIPELAEFAPAKKRVISDWLRRKKNLPDAVSCSRMVLFLVRNPEKAVPGKPDKPWLPTEGIWGGKIGMEFSVAWIESDEAIAFDRPWNPGDAVLLPQGQNECAMKCRVDEVLDARSAYDAALRQADSAKFAAALPTILRTYCHPATRAVFARLEKDGKGSLPAIRSVLQNESLLHCHSDAIKSLVEVGGAGVGAELTTLLKAELEFWKKRGPNLKVNFLRGAGLDGEDLFALFNHRSKAIVILRAIEKLRVPVARDAVVAFRDYWRSLPQLRESSDLDKWCDEALKALDKLQMGP